jgi:hypothetical protein
VMAQAVQTWHLRCVTITVNRPRCPHLPSPPVDEPVTEIVEAIGSPLHLRPVPWILKAG